MVDINEHTTRFSADNRDRALEFGDKLFKLVRLDIYFVKNKDFVSSATVSFLRMNKKKAPGVKGTESLTCTGEGIRIPNRLILRSPDPRRRAFTQFNFQSPKDLS